MSAVTGQRRYASADAAGRDRARRMPAPQLALLAGLIAVGLGLRLWIAFTNYGVDYDTTTATIVGRLLTTHPLRAYVSLRYPYPSGYFPLLALCHWVAAHTGIAFWKLWKVPAIIADAGISVVLAWGLRGLGASQREQIAAVALVALGPIFVLVAGYHGQLDPAAILPALAGVIVWQRGREHRAPLAGSLLGIATAIKTVPLFLVLALLPTARSRREAAALIACAAVIPLAAVVPFLIATPHATWYSLTFNNGVPGWGGLSLLVQPSLLHGWLDGHLPHVSAATWFFTRKQNAIVGAAVLAAGAFAWRRRLDPIAASALIWLAVYVANFNWAPQYWVWGLPFFLLAGRLREVAAMQLALLVPELQLYLHPWAQGLWWLAFALDLLIWCALAAASARLMLGRWRPGLRAWRADSSTSSPVRWPSS